MTRTSSSTHLANLQRYLQRTLQGPLQGPLPGDLGQTIIYPMTMVRDHLRRPRKNQKTFRAWSTNQHHFKFKNFVPKICLGEQFPPLYEHRPFSYQKFSGTRGVTLPLFVTLLPVFLNIVSIIALFITPIQL